MRAPRFPQALVLPCLMLLSPLALTACLTAPPADPAFEAQALMTVTGRATYRERMAAPEGSVLKVELSDTSRADAPAISLADWSDSLDDGGVPKTFTLRINDALDPRGTYTLRATVTGPDGALLWTTDTVHRILPAPGTVAAGELVMVRVSPSPEADEDAASDLSVSGREWQVVSVGGEATTGERPPKIHFGRNGRLSGFGGCNGFGGNFKESQGSLTFGDIASTLMACRDDGTNARESALLTTLRGSVEKRAGQDGQIILTGGNNTEIILQPAAFMALAGSSWQVEAMGGTAIIAGHEPQLNFDADGRINGTTGCNRFFGSYTQTGSVLTFSGTGMTKMACMAEGVMEQETAFGAILSGEARAETDAQGNLIIRGEDGIAFTARPLPADGVEPAGDPAALTGAAWQAEDINRGGIIDNTVLTLTFTEEGRVSGSTHCNSLSGTYTATGTEVTFSPLAMTRRACIAPALAAQEARFAAALQGTLAWRITADGALELTREGGHRLLMRR